MFGVETVLRLLAPYDCLVCGAEGELVCDICLPRAMIRLPTRCFRCNRPPVSSSICAECRMAISLDDIWIGAAYQGFLRQLIRRFKFDRAKDARSQLARILATRLPVLPAVSLISYVPTATSRVRERGYDHAKQLAAAYARIQGRKISRLLTRHGQARQVGASRAQRLSQLESAFTVRGDVAGRWILLIDDVVTTGASLQAAALVLRAAGAASVSALVIGQKPRTHPDKAFQD